MNPVIVYLLPLLQSASATLPDITISALVEARSVDISTTGGRIAACASPEGGSTAAASTSLPRGSLRGRNVKAMLDVQARIGDPASDNREKK
jgi:hypothetical protein